MSPDSKTTVNQTQSRPGGPVDLDALMEAKGGEAAARWRAAGVSRRACEAYREAEQAYWETEDLRYLKVQTVATLRMAETTLMKSELNSTLRQHGWSEQFVEAMAERCVEFREQVETDTFADPNPGYVFSRSMGEGVSPKWTDLDELSVAIALAGRMLDILSQRLGLDRNVTSE